MTKSTAVSTLSTVSTTAASLDDDKTSNTKQQLFRLPTINQIENNRIHRRMESTYKDHSYWVKHRSKNRLWHHIRTMPRSIIYQTIRRPVRYITYISTFVVLWNCLVLLSKATTATFNMPHQVTFLFRPLLVVDEPLNKTQQNSQEKFCEKFCKKGCYSCKGVQDRTFITNLANVQE